jgi:hypothetical protein
MSAVPVHQNEIGVIGKLDMPRIALIFSSKMLVVTG